MRGDAPPPPEPSAAELAALLCPDAPNDIAPIDQATRRAERPARLPVDPESSGFGGDA